MNREWTIRPATEADVAILARHRCEMFRDMGELPDELYARLGDETQRYLETVLPTGEYVAWVAVLTDDPVRVIAGAGVQLRRILPRPVALGDRRTLVFGPEGIVLNVFTEREWRRRGVAESLMRVVIDWAKANGVRPLVLHASRDGRALYERLRFAQTNEMRLMD